MFRAGDFETTLALVRLQLVCERGKEALGEGHNSIGDLLPGYFSECGLREVTVYQSDQATPLIPPEPYGGRCAQQV